ncbi:MAG: class I SAM-dependent rRNA methyltransferase [Firmicutes bacterium]|nr:class I SAM-dependent rRNA methyltransferase [Bacillota bacterium]MDD4263518.1 class I SAM-dependent rRNA methyltransferase [Bacillota bacterium]MDD4693394.1 class I SAM-dependent rRNA methyltransferase [Bacillota bacterium]
MLIVLLKSNREAKVLNGYPNIYRDEVKKVEGLEEDGAICNVFSDGFRFLGKGLYSKSNVSVRMLTLKDEEIDGKFFRKRVEEAALKRKGFGDSYRLIHGEADLLPGVICDKYQDYLVLQIRSVGMERYKTMLISAIVDVVMPKGIYERSDFLSSASDILTRNVGLLYGENPPDEMSITEHGILYKVDIKKGQKTGFFFDQRDSRFFVSQITPQNGLALDAFAFTGGFALNMAKSGASRVIALDKDEDAVTLGIKNAAINGLANVEFITTRYENYMKSYQGEPFDIIVLDPPSVIKKKEERKKGLEIFQNIVSLAIPHLKDGGILGLCSCAYQLDLNLLIDAIRKAYNETFKVLQVIGVTSQSKDHPWILSYPESLYLKCIWVKVS